MEGNQGNLSILIELVKESTRQTASLREAIDVKMDLLSNRLEEKVLRMESSLREQHRAADVKVDRLYAEITTQVDELDSKVHDHSNKISQYEQMFVNLKWLVGTVLAAVAALVAVLGTITGFQKPPH